MALAQVNVTDRGFRQSSNALDGPDDFFGGCTAFRADAEMKTGLSCPVFLRLQLVDKSGGDVGTAEAFLQQYFDQMVLRFVFTGLEDRPKLVEENAGTGLFNFGECRNFGAMNSRFCVTLNLFDL